jgi:hypothetical protein
MLRRTTPNLLRTRAVVIGVIAFAATVASASYAASAQGHVVDVLRTQAPSVHATGDFLLRVEDMDAQLGNALLISGDTSLKTSRAQSVKLYEGERRAADADLQAATTALAGNPAALDQLGRLVDMFGSYQQLATRALQLDEQSNTVRAGTAPADVVAAYQNALRYLAGDPGDQQSDSLIAHAQALYAVSNALITRSAQDAEHTMSSGEGVLLGLSLLLLWTLAVVQWRITRQFHRAVNPGLAAASLTAVALLVAGAVGFQSAISDFHSGKSDAFDSIQSLTRAKAISYDANADETRWLLDPRDATRYEAAFVGKAEQIAQPAGTPDETDVTAYESGISQVEAALTRRVLTGDDLAAMNPLRTDSLLGFELGNITFTGEQTAALIVVSDYDAYLRGDAKIRLLPVGTPAALHDAIEFDTDSVTPGTSDQTFNAYSRALDDLIAINSAAFESSMTSALADLDALSWAPYVFLVLIVGLTGAGLRPRLVEYR